MDFNSLYRMLVETSDNSTAGTLDGRVEWEPEDAISKALLGSIVGWLAEHGIKGYVVNADGTIDIEGDLVVKNHTLGALKNFNHVEGDVILRDAGLCTLAGFPKTVGGMVIDIRGNPNLKGEDLVQNLPRMPEEFDGAVMVDDKLKPFVLGKRGGTEAGNAAQV